MWVALVHCLTFLTLSQDAVPNYASIMPIFFRGLMLVGVTEAAFKFNSRCHPPVHVPIAFREENQPLPWLHMLLAGIAVIVLQSRWERRFRC